MKEPYVESLWHVGDEAGRNQLTERFLAAHSQDDYEELNQRYPRVFGLDARGQTVDDISSVCELMRGATEILAFARTEGDLDLPALQWRGLGLMPVVVGWQSKDDPNELTDASYSLTFARQIKGANYCKWLSKAVRKVNERFPYRDYAMSFSDSDGVLSDSTDNRPVIEMKNLAGSCSHILSQLITLHLADMATVYDEERMAPTQKAYSGISALWLGLSERLSCGRAFRCDACGRPSVAYGERRRKRYCCEACRKWANANPGKKRGHWYMER